jgi:hypothetical protein
MKRRILAIVPAVLFIVCASHTLPLQFRASTGSAIYYSGGNGESKDSAILIRGALRQSEGIEAEHYFLGRMFGEKGKAWDVQDQTIIREEKRIYDMVEIQLMPSLQKRIFYFDVSKLPWVLQSPKQERE